MPCTKDLLTALQLNNCNFRRSTPNHCCCCCCPTTLNIPQGTKSSKKKKQAKLKRVMATLKKAAHKEAALGSEGFAALHLLHDPQVTESTAHCSVSLLAVNPYLGDLHLQSLLSCCYHCLLLTPAVGCLLLTAAGRRAVAHRDAAVAHRDAAVAHRDAAVAHRDAACSHHSCYRVLLLLLQGFAERLFGRLQGSRERWETRLDMMTVVSRWVAAG
jgi:hypothetical protein